MISKMSPNVYKSCKNLQKLPKNVGDLDKIIVAKALKSCPKSKKLPNLVTLLIILTIPCIIILKMDEIRADDQCPASCSNVLMSKQGIKWKL